MPHLTENPMKIGWLVPEMQAVEGFSTKKKEKEKKKKEKKKENKGNFYFYLKINICQFRLSFLDHITV